jgi:hypothetical protein
MLLRTALAMYIMYVRMRVCVCVCVCLRVHVCARLELDDKRGNAMSTWVGISRPLISIRWASGHSKLPLFEHKATINRQ